MTFSVILRVHYVEMSSNIRFQNTNISFLSRRVLPDFSMHTMYMKEDMLNVGFTHFTTVINSFKKHVFPHHTQALNNNEIDK